MNQGLFPFPPGPFTPGSQVFTSNGVFAPKTDATWYVFDITSGGGGGSGVYGGGGGGRLIRMVLASTVTGPLNVTVGQTAAAGADGQSSSVGNTTVLGGVRGGNTLGQGGGLFQGISNFGGTITTQAGCIGASNTNNQVGFNSEYGGGSSGGNTSTIAGAGGLSMIGAGAGAFAGTTAGGAANGGASGNLAGGIGQAAAIGGAGQNGRSLDECGSGGGSSGGAFAGGAGGFPGGGGGGSNSSTAGAGAGGRVVIYWV